MKSPSRKNRVFVALCVVLIWATCLLRLTVATHLVPAKMGDKACRQIRRNTRPERPGMERRR